MPASAISIGPHSSASLRFSQDFLDSRQCQRGVGGDALSNLLRFFQRRPRSGQFADEPVLLGVDG
jgi:hypothetical protein